MTESMIARIVRREGEPVLVYPRPWRRAIARLATAGATEVVLTIATATDERRSTIANRYYWALLAELAAHTGYDRYDLHEYFKARLLAKPLTIVNAAGLAIDERQIAGSTRVLDRASFAAYVDQVLAFAVSELGFMPARQDVSDTEPVSSPAPARGRV